MNLFPSPSPPILPSPLSWCAPWFPWLRATQQLADPALLGTVLASLALSGFAFVVLGGGLGWLAWTHVAFWLAGWSWMMGPFGLLAGWLAGWVVAHWLFVPLAMVIAATLVDPVSRAVERRWYPLLPPPRGASLAVQAWDGAMLGGRVLVLNTAALALAVLLPGPGWFLGWGVAAWGVGRGLFVAVAMRREGRAAALARYRRRRGVVLLHGLVLALLMGVPLLNLFAPVLGTAVMVHVLHDPAGA